MDEPGQLVGRTAELERLDRALAELRRGRAAALEIAGEPGMGKTRLLSELGARADARGHLVLAGSASELEAELPYAVFVDALDDYVHGLEPGRLDRLGADALAELAQILPSAPAITGRGPPPATGRHQAHRALRRALEVLAASTPVVVLLDDLHWADTGSIELLGALLRRPPAAPVLIALAVRPHQRPERLASALERAERAGALERLELAALTPAEARRMLGERVDAATAAELHERSGGNPFYLEQLARALQRASPAVPDGVAAALAEELAALPAGTRRVLEGAAVAGDPFELDLAAAAAGEDAGAVLDALDELLRRDLVRHTDVPRRFRFRHPLVRRAVYEAAPGGWRIAAHARAARALEATGAAVALRAHHVERSAEPGDLAAVAVLREAARAAAPRAPATAARLLDAAVRLLPAADPQRLELLTDLAGAHASAGNFAAMHAATLRALELAPTPHPQLAAQCARVEHLLGLHDEAHARLEAALAELADPESPEAVPLLLELATDAFYRMDYRAMCDWAWPAAQAARERGPLASALSMLSLARAFAGDVVGADASRAEAAALVDTMSDAELAPCLDFALDTLAGAELHLDRVAEATAHVERSLAIARATGQDHVLPILFWSGMIRAGSGRLGEAADVLETAVEIARISDHAEGVAWNLFARSLTATAAGDAETALAAAEEAVDALHALARSFPTMGAGFALATALAEAGEPARARDALLASGDGPDLTALPAVWRPAAQELLARCHLALGERDEAIRAATRAGGPGTRLAAGHAHRAAAAVALAAGDRAAALDRSFASAIAFDAAGAPVESARARVLAGAALAAGGARDRAATELRRAAATFDACGADHRRAGAERELGRLGARPHRRTRRGKPEATGLESLTERELEVAHLVVDRRTNAEIADTLFLSPKTVESHMRHLFEKLGVSSRVEVARAVQRLERV